MKLKGKLQKFFSLTLVASMLLSMLTVGAAAAETVYEPCGEDCQTEHLGASKTAKKNDDKHGWTVTLKVPGAEEEVHNEYLVMFDASTSITNDNNWRITKELVGAIGEKVLAKTDVTNTMQLMSYAFAASTVEEIESQQELGQVLAGLNSNRFRYGISSTNIEGAMDYMDAFLKAAEADYSSVIFITDGRGNVSNEPVAYHTWMEDGAPNWGIWSNDIRAGEFMVGVFLPRILMDQVDKVTDDYYTSESLLTACLKQENVEQALEDAKTAKADQQKAVEDARERLAQMDPPVTEENIDTFAEELDGQIEETERSITSKEAQIKSLESSAAAKEKAVTKAKENLAGLKDDLKKAEDEAAVSGVWADAYALRDDVKVAEMQIAQQENVIKDEIKAIEQDIQSVKDAKEEAEDTLEEQNKVKDDVELVTGEEETAAECQALIDDLQAILDRFDEEGSYVWGDTTDEQKALMNPVSGLKFIVDEWVIPVLKDKSLIPYADLQDYIYGDITSDKKWQQWSRDLWNQVYRDAGWEINRNVSALDLMTAFIEYDEDQYGSDGFRRETLAATEYMMYSVGRYNWQNENYKAAAALAKLCETTDVTVINLGGNNWLSESGWKNLWSGNEKVWESLGIDPADYVDTETYERPYNGYNYSYSAIMEHIDQILEDAYTSPYYDATITDYMSKWAVFQHGSVRIYDDQSGQMIYNDEDGWLIDNPPVKGKPYEVVAVAEEDYAEGGENVIGNENGIIYKLTWKVKDDALLRTDLYRMEYDVVVDTEETGFEWDTEYPANGTTTLTTKDPEEGVEHPEDIAVPDIYAEAVYYDVTVNYYDDDTKETIAESYVSEPELDGTEYDVSEYDAIDIDDYVYIRTEGDELTGILDEDKVIDVYYKGLYNVTVNYYDQDGNVIHEAYVGEEELSGTEYDVTEQDAIEIEGYIYVRTTGDAVSGVLDEDKVVDVYYRLPEQLPRYSVTVNYYDLDGKVIHDSYVSEAMVVDSEYDVSEYDAIDIDGYVYEYTRGDAVEGILDEDKIVDVYYSKKPSGGGMGGGTGGETPDVPVIPGPIFKPTEPEKPETPKQPEVPEQVEDPEIPMGETPDLPKKPEVELEEILEEDIPLAGVPETGDISALWLALSALSGSGLLGLKMTKGKKEDEE